MGKVVVGYRYYIGLHMAFCHGPVDSVRELRVADKVAWPVSPANDVPQPVYTIQDMLQVAFGAENINGRPLGTVPSSQGAYTGIVPASGKIYINNLGLFGGEEREGGVQGFVSFHFGGATEGQNAYLRDRLSPNVPAFRGVLTAVAEQCYVAAMNPYIKPWSITATRIFAQSDGSTQWYSAKAAINTLDMNPAHIIRECLTNKIYGKGRDSIEIDNAYFTAAADTLYAEGFGLSFVWADTRDVDTFVQTVLQHIDGTIYQDRVTNKWRIKLARNDYNPDTIPVFNEDNIVEVQQLGRPLPSELVNQVTLTYWNRATHKNDTIIIDNTGLQDAIGGQINPNDIDRTGITSTDLANRVASRELRTLSTSLLAGTMTVNRSGLNVNMCDPFKLVYPRRGVAGVVCRVTGINYGTKDDETITITFIEDIFALPTSSYLVANPSLWTDPRVAPQPSLYRYLGEMPYWEIIRTLDNPAEYATFSPTGGFMQLGGTRQSGMTYNMHAWAKQGGAQYQDLGFFGPCASVRIPAAVGREETSTVLVDSVIDPAEIYYQAYASWDTEMIQVLDYNHATGILIMARGVLDTVPQEHAANSRILFIDGHSFLDASQHEQGETIDARIVTITAGGELELSAAPTNSYAFAARHIRPYAPGKFRVNGSLYPSNLYGEDVTITWAHRNRLQQTAYIVQQGENSIGPEPTATYTVRVKNSAGTTVRTVTGITGTSFSYTNAFAIADGRLTDVTFEVQTVVGTYTSWQSQTTRSIRNGLGFNLGNNLGGGAP